MSSLAIILSYITTLIKYSKNIKRSCWCWSFNTNLTAANCRL